MKKKHHLLIAGGIALGVVVIAVLVGMFCRSNDVGLSNGGFVHITYSKDSCRLFYQPRDREAGTIAFLELSILHLDEAHLAFIAPAADGNCLLILYDADIHYRLIRVDPSKQFDNFPESSYLHYIVQSSPWKIEEGTSNDWQEVGSYLKTVPQKVFDHQAATTFDLGIARFHYKRKELIAEIEREIDNSKHGWTY